MFITGKSLPRRTFIRGAVGAAIALPFLDAMVPALTAQSRTAANGQLRFGGVYLPNGVLPDRWHPDTTGPDFEFKPAMKPLEPFRNQLVTVSGLVGSGTPGPHLGSSAGWLNGVGAIGRQGEPILSGKTVDQYLADKIGQDTPLPSIEIGTEDMGTSIGACDGFACVYFNSLAWRTDTFPLPVDVNPRITFERMYGETGSTSQRRTRLELRRSLLDSVLDEATRLKGQLGPRDQAMVDQYLDNVREVERRIQRVMERSANDADLPPAPTGVPGSVDEHVALNYDLMHLALQGDISRVFTFLLANEASDLGYSFIDIPESHHVCSHHGDDPTAIEKYTSIVTWHTLQLAGFAKKLADTPDGDGSLLDHTLLYYGSGMSNGNQHDRFTPPAVLLGGANGRLKGNNHVRMGNREPAANLLLNIADIFEVPLEKIGPGTGRVPL